MYEHKNQRPLHSLDFLRRILAHTSVAIGLLAFSLGMGVLGYSYFENLTLVDAFLNSAMLLGGMGPVNTPMTNGGKLFAGIYALYAGLVFIVAAAIIMTPLAHRLLHKFHWDDE